MKTTSKKSAKDTLSIGSALILAVVLTSLLAIIGVMFVMIARVDKMATSAISENKELNFAVETVVAKISQELVLDVPGVAGQEYYDYPGDGDKWLASLEPYQSGSNYYWRRISDIYNRLDANNLQAIIIPDYQKPSDVGDSNSTDDYPADADGDGIADSKWVKLDDITSNKGKPIYAAIRIVDNGGMINVNTAYKFDPTSSVKNEIDGSSQMQINLFALSERGSTSNPLGKLDDARFGSEPLPHVLDDYIEDVVWRYNEPNGRYTPFDISDELELRNRFTLNRTDVDSRIEEVWDSAFQGPGYLSVPVSSSSSFSDWREEVYYDLSEPNATKNYSYRHIGTIYNMDRIIDPNGVKMANVNTADVNALYNSIRKGLLNTNYIDVNGVAAQIAVNLIDFRDNDSNVTVYTNPDDGKDYYGFESPCIYISELVHRFVEVPNPIPGEPNIIYRSYAVELYKPYSGDNDPCNWRLEVGSTPITIDNWTGNKQFYVIRDQNSNALLDVNSGTTIQDASFAFTANTEISLQRPLPGGGYVAVDWYRVDPCIPPPWLVIDGNSHSIQRDIQPHKCIRRLWDSNVRVPNLGQQNTFVHPDPNVIQAHPANEDFTNIGEIGMVFRKGAYYIDAADRPDRIGYGTNKTEEEVRIDLADPNFQQLFKYLTVFDPTVDGIDNDDDGEIDETDPNKTLELKVPGRININTAPWYVIAQLPWVSQRKGEPTNYKLAEAIVAYRDKLDLSSTGGPDYSGQLREPGFRNIGELNNVVDGNSRDHRMDYYVDGVDLAGFPDLTTPDHPLGGAPDDFEERDVIFARISNLVTVRSDVFTAYILVRIGADGPQKRVMAILDRSNVYSGDGKVRIVALHPVPDPR